MTLLSEILVNLNQLLITLERQKLVATNRSRAADRRQALVAHLEMLEADLVPAARKVIDGQLVTTS